MGASEFPGPINLGNPREINLIELAKIVVDITGSSSQLTFEDLPEDDPKRRCPDIKRARDVLGWEPVVGIEDGITKTAAWIAQS